jgi:ADP-ribosylglycohydrolase
MRRRDILRVFNGELADIVTFWTDDTQLALALLEPILQTGDFKPELAAKMFVKLARTDAGLYSLGLMRGAGGGFRKAIRNLVNGRSWRDSGTVTAGNGAAMRIAPFGVIYKTNAGRLRQKVCESAIITHHDPRGIAAAAAIAAGAAYAAVSTPDRFNPKDMLKHVFKFACETEVTLMGKYRDIMKPPRPGVEHHVSECIEPLVDYLNYDEEDAVKLIGGNADMRTEMGSDHPASVFCLASAMCALYFFAKYYFDFETAVVRVVNTGGDTDSTGAMVGGMAGALHGPGAIPDRWSTRIRGYSQLLVRAAALEGDKGALGDIIPLVELERGLTKQEAGLARDLAGSRKTGL